MLRLTGNLTSDISDYEDDINVAESDPEAWNSKAMEEIDTSRKGRHGVNPSKAASKAAASKAKRKYVD